MAINFLLQESSGYLFQEDTFKIVLSIEYSNEVNMLPRSTINPELPSKRARRNLPVVKRAKPVTPAIARIRH